MAQDLSCNPAGAHSAKESQHAQLCAGADGPGEGT